MKKDSAIVGNFGHLGLIDFLLGTVCKDEGNIVDDIKDEAEKHQLQERIDAAVHAALAARDNKRIDGAAGQEDNNVVERSGTERTNHDQTGDGALHDGPEGAQADRSSNVPRRSGRRKEAKG